MKAIILAGGFGGRLKEVVSDMPKPMADINGRPMLEILIQYLENQGFDEFIVSVHHMQEKIIKHFRHKDNIKFVTEDEPLGTGGAILHSIEQAKISGNIAVINGDSFLEIDYKKFFEAHGNNDLSLALCEVADTERYGRVELNGDKITSFREKGIKGKGLINTGFYVINSCWLAKQKLPKKFSVELDLFLPKIKEMNAGGFLVRDYFIDIGIPEDYARAKRELPILQVA